MPIPPITCGLCASVRAGGGGRGRRQPTVPLDEARRRLAAAKDRVDTLDLGTLAGLSEPRFPAPERVGDVDDVRGGVLAQAYAVMGRPNHGLVATDVARGLEAGATLVARMVAGLYVPPWVGGGGRIVFNAPVVAGLMAREDEADRDALATLVVAHERVHHVQHERQAWQDDFLRLVDGTLSSDRTTQREAVAAAQAVMSVVEGHASYVERLAVESIHPVDTWWRIRGRHLVARPPGLLQGLISVLFAGKRDQYKRGMLFSADAHDLEARAFELLFGRTEGMPKAHEIDDPAAWATRMSWEL